MTTIFALIPSNEAGVAGGENNDHVNVIAEIICYQYALLQIRLDTMHSMLRSEKMTISRCRMLIKPSKIFTPFITDDASISL